MRLSFAFLMTVGILALGAAPVTAQEGASPPTVRVYDAGELTLDRYTVIQRLWTGSWRASFWIPEHDDPASAIAALTSRAAALGADGVTHLHCVNDSRGWGAGYYCYGLAISLK
jgi:hypothetical protein